jgi:hypothetical protein
MWLLSARRGRESWWNPSEGALASIGVEDISEGAIIVS